MSYPLRVQYRERQRLRARDLRDEQEYLLGLAGRHNVGVHTWGIVRGLTVDRDGTAITVHPGVAVDGYGREIVIRDPIQIELEAGSKFVFLFACQTAEGGCGGSPSTHCRDEGKVIVTADELFTPEEGSSFSVVRAAGLACDTPPWPILLAEILTVVPEIDISKVRFTRVNVAQLAAASKTSTVKVGKSTRADQYPFLISTKDKTGGLANRIAVDQDGNVRFWGDVIVTESQLAPVLLNVDDELLRITPKAAAGGEIRWRSLIQEVDDRETVVLDFRDLYGHQELLNVPLEGDASNRRDEAKKFNARSRLVEVAFETGLTAVRNVPTLGIPILLPQAPANLGQNISAKTIDNHDSDFRHLSPTISFESEAEDDETELCGCREESDRKLVYPSGIDFKASLKAPSVPSRDIYNIKVGEKELLHEQLRASIGKFEDGDLSRRFSIGALGEDNNGGLKFNPWVKVRGNGAVEIPGGQVDQTGVPFLMLDVKGTLRLPPVKPDPRDPVFKSLLLMAFFHGVLSHGSSPITITFTTLPDFFETAQDLVYSITVANLDFTQSLKEIKGHDRLSSATPFSDLNLVTAPIIPRGARSYEITHHPIDFHDLEEVTIEVGIEGKIEDHKVASVGTSLIRPVIKSPLVDLSMIPAEVPAGWSTKIAIKNDADRNLTIANDLVAKNLGADQSLTPDTSSLSPHQTTQTTALKVPEDVSEGNHDLEVALNYHWPSPTDVRTVKAKQVVKVKKMLTAKTIATPVANAAWKFDLELTNPTENQVRLLGLKVFVSKAGSPTTQFDFSLDEKIRKHQKFTKTNLDGIVGPSGTIENIKIELKFRRLQKIWDGVEDELPPITIP